MYLSGVLFFIISVFSAATALASDTSPNTIDELFARLQSAGATTKAEVLAALPQEMKNNFVLVSNSRSRQQGTPELPRVLHFSKSANLIVSSSGHTKEEDFASNDLEVMELNRESGKWRMAMIHFENGKLEQPVINHRSCIACHGDNPRPIWGEYANWPDSYGGNPAFGVEIMGPEERGSFLTFMNLAKTHEGYKHLELQLSEKSFRLPATVYELPNTAFTTRLGQRQAESIFRRMQSAPAYPKLKLALLASSRRFCAENEGLNAGVDKLYGNRLTSDAAFASRWGDQAPQLAVTKILRLLDLDPFADFRLDKIPRLFDPKISEERVLEWNSSGDYLIGLVGFLVLHDAWKSDPMVQQLFAARSPEINRLYGLTSAPNEALLALDKQETSADYLDSLFPYVENKIFKAVLGSPDKPNVSCDYFAKIP